MQQMNPQGNAQMAMMQQQQHFRQQQQNPQIQQQPTYNMGQQQIRMNHPGVPPQNMIYQQPQLQQQHIMTEEQHQMNMQRFDFNF